jgi:hypothetical protein
VDRTEFEDFRQHQPTIRRLSYYAVLGLPLGLGFAVSSLWSFVGGAVVAVLLISAGMRLLIRWDKARWIKRFPELADPSITWRRGP